MREMTPERLAELRRIAQMATPGPWERDGRIVYALTHYGYRNGIEQRANKVTISVQKGHDCSAEEADAVALHIATFDPRMVLALLDEIERLRREREEIVDGETRFVLYHPDFDWWECQACRFLWEFENGNPYEDNMRFCPRCGRRIVREAQHLAGEPDQA